MRVQFGTIHIFPRAFVEELAEAFRNENHEQVQHRLAEVTGDPAFRDVKDSDLFRDDKTCWGGQINRDAFVATTPTDGGMALGTFNSLFKMERGVPDADYPLALAGQHIPHLRVQDVPVDPIDRRAPEDAPKPLSLEETLEEYLFLASAVDGAKISPIEYKSFQMVG